MFLRGSSEAFLYEVPRVPRLNTVHLSLTTSAIFVVVLQTSRDARNNIIISIGFNHSAPLMFGIYSHYFLQGIAGQLKRLCALGFSIDFFSLINLIDLRFEWQNFEESEIENIVFFSFN